MRYRIWFLYEDGYRRLEDSGAVEEADTPDPALVKAHRRGIGWGLGFNKNYKKAVALPVDLTDEV